MNEARTERAALRSYRRLLALCYAVGAALHVADLLDLRHHFSMMPLGWKVWIVWLAIFDTGAAVGLFCQRWWGVLLFVVIACAQLIAYVGFPGYFGAQYFLIGFHVVTLGAYGLLWARERRAA